MLRKSNTEEYICSKLLEMIQTTPFTKLKVTEFTRFANISRSSFYNYFDSLDDVIQKLEDDLFDGLDDEHSIDILEIKSGNSPKLINALSFINERLETYRLLTSENGDPYFQIRLANRSSKILEKWAKQSNTKLSESQLKMVIEHISGGRWQMYLWWANNPDKITLEEVAEITIKLMNPMLNIIKK